jgi:hypothetical protein
LKKANLWLRVSTLLKIIYALQKVIRQVLCFFLYFYRFHCERSCF